MGLVKGKFATAKIFAKTVEEEALKQIGNLCDQEFASGSKIRIMPDVHAGAGCTIGTTMTITDKVVPNLVGVDIGCGVLSYELEESYISFTDLDKVIEDSIPIGFSIREHPWHDFGDKAPFLRVVGKLDNLKIKDKVNKERAIKSLGTLGGGNHFIEVNRGLEGNLFLTVHSGSRYLGKQVADYYQGLAVEQLEDIATLKQEFIKRMRLQGRESEIQAGLEKIKPKVVDKDLAYLEGRNLDNYLYDMGIVQEYADVNRRLMLQVIIDALGLTVKSEVESVHNYIDLASNILRKGAISAKKGERVLIPFNMRDGVLLGVGKGNADWNYSAPHGAGRLMSRKAAREALELVDFKEQMVGIWSPTVGESTLEESPMVYKPMDEIVEALSDTVEIVGIMRPLYNYKA